MYRKLLKSKIHRATVTDSNLEYEGSITIDRDLLDGAGIVEYELVQVVNLNNGARFETYVICGERGSGIVALNGAAARLAQVGDRVIIMSYGLVEEKDLESWNPARILVNEKNQVKELLCC
jgi:aspartate 1-decarboxylase